MCRHDEMLDNQPEHSASNCTTVVVPSSSLPAAMQQHAVMHSTEQTSIFICMSESYRCAFFELQIDTCCLV